MCLSLSFDTGDLGSSGVGWANAIMLRSKKVPSRPRVPTKGLGISSGSAANRFSRCGLAGLFQFALCPARVNADSKIMRAGTGSPGQTHHNDWIKLYGI